ncbi:ribonuclease HII [Brevibacillus daliensis]|uniref:ribonuclease HII n=1 Tax=Brevibacillus daliensis TaxID=2892995 RepID=UPI001E3F925F|nr:ribonuclease HII [Brevibacillus daliensis]
MNINEMSIQQIRAILAENNVTDELRSALSSDQRKGVQDLLRKLEAQEKKQAQQKALWDTMTQYEKAYWEQGKSIVVGIDEVGRGPLAGPVVAAAVSLPADFYLPGLNDSKKVPPALREAYYEVIMRDALSVGIGNVSSERIDEINILEATKEAMYEAVTNLGVSIDACLIDAVHLAKLPYEQISLIGGDGKSVSIAAASIIAKVTRDRLMQEYALTYPEYGFAQHAGYGTAEHLHALRTYGPSPIHRKSFGGVKELISL